MKRDAAAEKGSHGDHVASEQRKEMTSEPAATTTTGMTATSVRQRTKD